MTTSEPGCAVFRSARSCWFSAAVMSGGLYAGAGIDAAFHRYGKPAALGGVDVWCLLVGYGFLLYFSFCGFSHVVIGAARLFGIQLHENFNRPYLSTTPSEFWTRWHMSFHSGFVTFSFCRSPPCGGKCGGATWLS